MNQNTLAAVLVGAAITLFSTAGVEWLRYSLTRRQRKADRWEASQHDSLVALSDQLAIITPLLVKILTTTDADVRLTAVREYGHAHFRLCSLVVRINDLTLADRSQRVIDVGLRMLEISHHSLEDNEAKAIVKEMHEASDQMNYWIGHLLRNS